MSTRGNLTTVLPALGILIGGLSACDTPTEAPSLGAVSLSHVGSYSDVEARSVHAEHLKRALDSGAALHWPEFQRAEAIALLQLFSLSSEAPAFRLQADEWCEGEYCEDEDGEESDYDVRVNSSLTWDSFSAITELLSGRAVIEHDILIEGVGFYDSSGIWKRSSFTTSMTVNAEDRGEDDKLTSHTRHIVGGAPGGYSNSDYLCGGSGND